MNKDKRSPLNPFTGKKHYDVVDDDEFLSQSYENYYDEISQYELLDQTQSGQLVFDVSINLINTINDYLFKIGRFDYVEDYYDWEIHLVNSDIANAACYPGGKIVVYAGILDYVNSEEDLAFILGHEISHALLDHSRTAASVEKTKNTLSSASWIGSFALDMLGFEGAGELTRAAVNVADVGSHYFLTKPWGRNHELEADKLGLIITYLSGYDVNGIPDFWQRFSQAGSNDFDFFSTHPSDEKRIAVMRESLFDVNNTNDFYSKPLLSQTPTPKKDFTNNQNNFNQHDNYSSDYAPQNDMSTKTCSNCGCVNKFDDNYCMDCGLILNQQFCSSCGEKINIGDNYCMFCGKKLN